MTFTWDYDKLKEIADNHTTLRKMPGHVGWFDRKKYPLQTLKDNISFFTLEILDDINTIVVNYGNSILKKKAEKLKGENFLKGKESLRKKSLNF